MGKSLEQRLTDLNADLKKVKAGVTVRRRGDKLSLRATLPPKPGSSRSAPHQQEIYLGVYANAAGLKLAKAEALALSGLVASNRFSWDRYTKKSNSLQRTTAEWIADFKQDYFQRRSRNPKSQTTWDKDYRDPFKKLPPDKLLTGDLLKSTILTTEPDTKARQRICMAFSALAKFAGVELDTKPLKGNYSPRSVQVRDLPGDELIAEWRDLIPNPAWRWAYGMLAAYGLRNHEIFNLDLDTIREKPGPLIVKDSKTGERQVWPCLREWWEQWQLYEVQLPQVTGRSNSDYGHRVTKYFQYRKIPFRPYDLRHAWAVRTAVKGLDPSIAAKMMGHSLQLHFSCYQQFFDEQHFQAAWEAMR